MTFFARQRWVPMLTAVAILTSVCGGSAQVAARWAMAGCNNVGTIFSGQSGGATISLDNLMFQSEEAKCAAIGFPQSMELLRDGSGIVDNRNTPWKIQGNRIYFMGSPAMAFNYKLSGATLTLTNDNKNEAVYLEPSAVKAYAEKRAAEAAKIKAEQEKKKAEQRFEKISGYFTDSRNGQKYRSVNIGGKTWMAQNLNYQTGKSWCYDNKKSNCDKYGRLYDWGTAKTACPTGWHLPSVMDWDNLSKAAGGTREVECHQGECGYHWSGAGDKLQSASGWDEYGIGTDKFGFSALPSGTRYSDGSFGHAGSHGYWWTATENDGNNAHGRIISGGDAYVDEYEPDKGYGLSVRCVAD